MNIYKAFWKLDRAITNFFKEFGNMPATNKITWKEHWKLLLILGAAIVLIPMAANWIDPLPPLPPASPVHSEGGFIPTQVDAHGIAKRFIEAQLKAPSSADFPWLDYQYTELPGHTWRITSYVDAQNSFGAKLRRNWSCTLKWNGGATYDASSWAVTGFCGLIE
jgi:hypothetical protein